MFQNVPIGKRKIGHLEDQTKISNRFFKSKLNDNPEDINLAMFLSH